MQKLRSKGEIKLWDAYHLDTQKGYYAWEIWGLWPDPHDENWVCCPICKKKVTPYIAHTRNTEYGEVDVQTHFKLQDGNSGGCISKESDEHKNAKILIANLVDNKKINLKVDNCIIPNASLNYSNVPHLSFRWEQTRGDQRADILFELKEWHLALGQGIDFEIQTKEMSTEKKLEREFKWISKGYSLAWLPTSLFGEDFLTINEIIIDNVWAIKFAELINNRKNSIIDAIYQSNQKFSEKQEQITTLEWKINAFESNLKNKLENVERKINTSELSWINKSENIEGRINALEPGWGSKSKYIEEKILSYSEDLRFLDSKMTKLRKEIFLYESRKPNTCRTCIYSKVLQAEPALLTCSFGTTTCKYPEGIGLSLYASKHEGIDTCSNYKNDRRLP